MLPSLSSVPNSQTTIACNSVVWISSLPASEQLRAKFYEEDVAAVLAAQSVPLHFFVVEDANQFVTIFERIKELIVDGCRPIIHLDLHGSKNSGLMIEPSQEFISWKMLFGLLQELNIKLENNLIVVSAVCFGMRAIMPISMHTLTPFHVLIAPQEKISLHELFSNAADFYRDLFDIGDIQEAMKSLPTMDYFHCERTLAIILARYVFYNCMGDGKVRRIRDLIAIQRDEFPSESRTDVQLAAVFSDILDDSLGPQLIYKYAQTFLAGVLPSFVWADIEEMVSKIRPKAS
jgi:hypothetical protein